MKIIFIGDGHSNQRALANKIHNLTKLNIIIVCTAKKNKKLQMRLIAKRVWQLIALLITGLKFRKSWFGTLSYFEEKYKSFPNLPILYCNDVNDKVVHDTINKIKPDLVLVSGTNLLKDNIINEISKYGKVMNLHTGISPYIKGGPNSTNWCLALREFWLIGNTVIWLDKGIDSGNIITSERTPISGNESLLELQIKVMNHAHNLYLKCIKKFIDGEILPNVPQKNFQGKRLFLSKDWGLYQMVLALFNYYFYYYSNSRFLKKPKNIKLIDIDKEI